MALSDTARLIASLELEDKFSKTADKYNKALSGMERKTGTLEKVGFQVGRGARNAIDNIGRIAVVGAGLVASQVALGVRSLAELETVQNQTEAVIKSTGGAANVTADQIRGLSESMEDLTTIDDKAIQAGENMLLTFTNIRNEVGEGNDIFNQASEAVLDLSAAMGTAPKDAALQLGKALNDPVRGLTALRRVGIQFTEQQEEQIKKMVESGHVLEAQKVIIAELNKEFGGSAKAFGEGPAATMRRFGDAVEGAQQALATGFLPVMERVSTLVQDTLKDPAVLANIRKFGEGLAGGVEDLIAIGTKLPWEAIGNSAVLMGKGAKALLDAFTGLPPWIQTAVLTGWGLNKLTGGALGNIAGTIVGALGKGILQRGGTPATPLFTKEVGIPGTPGGGVPPAVAGPLAGIGGLPGLAAILATIGGGVSALVATNKAVEQGQVNLTSALQSAQGPGGLIERAVEDLLGIIGIKIRNDVILGGKDRPQGAATPIGQFNPLNAGGTPVPVKLVPGGGAFTAVEAGIRTLRDQVRTSLKEGDVHAARIAEEQRQNLLRIAGRIDRATNTVVPKIGETNRGLSVANRNLQDGNARQRDIAAGVREARDRIGTGFQATNANLSTSNSRLATIAAKDFSPKISVTVPVTNNVSISEVTRTATSYAFSTGSGFTSTGNSNTP